MPNKRVISKWEKRDVILLLFPSIQFGFTGKQKKTDFRIG